MTVAVLLSAAASHALAQAPDRPAQPSPAATPAAAVPGNSGFTWAISERVRYAGLINQFRPGLSGDDQALVSRTTLRGNLALPHVTFVGELQDARAYFTDDQSNVSTALVDPIDLVQAYVLLGSTAREHAGRPTLQAGRFAMELGSGRLVAQEAYRDVTRAFTGLKLRWGRPGRGASPRSPCFPC